jgi:hypothetical protein
MTTAPLHPAHESSNVALVAVDRKGMHYRVRFVKTRLTILYKSKRSSRGNKRKTFKASSTKETSFDENRINTIVPVYTNPKEAAWRIIELDLTNLEP